MVVRINKDMSIKNSTPCIKCLETLKLYNIKKIIYSNEHGDFVSEKPSKLDVSYQTTGWKFFGELKS